ncbi:efflux RND transporter periplasmic adaptor subunit [Endozoicomonas sp. SM1973]|uniref:Efflux RND transporter periplasmic adaptor subunit n=1 Tax=Spartinivicinus marinus TaxID=2994442 RepID=A0A853HYW6_9GAMM|nr:efflux RND transporter periplasmic adaptor subunit [Spartinivicinus marinus]MCX4029689.1 efflux RND transporter periplasmic adaptor subunit [Spartinivicinus marinus]NYZ66930.1 efflux RND transporter periplasmic adaptor subunit [Spartinivicinus marinus]
MNWLKVLAPIGILTGALVLNWQLSNTEQAPTNAAKPMAKLPVETQSVKPTQIQFTITSQGAVQPRTETTLVSQVSGKVTAIAPAFVSGGTFKAGDTLLKIDPLDYQVAVEQAKAQLAQAKAKLIEEQGKATTAKKDWLREGRHVKQASDLVLRKPYIIEAQAAVKAAQADLKKAKHYLAQTTIHAPYDGMVKTKQVDVGQFVSASNPLGVIFATDYAEVRLPIKRSDLAFLQLPEFGHNQTTGPAATLSIWNAASAATWQAQITRQEGVIDEKTRMHYVVARIADPYGLQKNNQQAPLHLGTFVKAAITGVTMNNLTPIPRHLLRKNQQLLVVDKNNTLQLRKVSVVREGEALAYLQSGLKTGDQLCLTAIPSPINGAAVVVQNNTEQSAAKKQAVAQLNEKNNIQASAKQPSHKQLSHKQLSHKHLSHQQQTRADQAPGTDVSSANDTPSEG